MQTAMDKESVGTRAANTPYVLTLTAQTCSPYPVNCIECCYLTWLKALKTNCSQQKQTNKKHLQALRNSDLKPWLTSGDHLQICYKNDVDTRIAETTLESEAFERGKPAGTQSKQFQPRTL